MSRRVIRSDGFYEVAVGWDPPLNTFFAQVYDRQATALAEADDPEADEVMAVWVGVSPHAIGNVPQLQAEIGEYAAIDHATFNDLCADKALNR